MIYHLHNTKTINQQLQVSVTMEGIILLILVCLSFCSFTQTSDNKDSAIVGEPLDVFLHKHALKDMLSHPQPHGIGTLFEVKLPDNLSGMNISYVRLRSKTLWRKGANFSNFQVPPRTLPMPYVKRYVIFYQDLGKLSSQFYKHAVPGYSIVSSVVGFRVYDASNPTMRKIRKHDFNISTNAPISVRFQGLKFPRGAKCASFGVTDCEVSLADMSDENMCCTRSYVIFLSFVGVMLMKIMKAKALDEMEMKLEEGSEDLDTVWIGYSKMPCATVTRTDPNLENAVFAGDMSLGILFPGDMSLGKICRGKLAGDSFPYKFVVGSPGASTTPIYSPGSSTTLIYSSGSSTPPRYSPRASTPQSYSPGTSRNAECSNCKHLLGKITVLEATVEMYMHTEQHTVNSAALFHEVYNNMGKLGLE
ncbi:hypothetical protein Tco_1135283 [Tanacetum coccineum]